MAQAPVVACFGRRGVGKTTLARMIARHQSRLVVWDYLGEYGPLAFRTSDTEALAEYLVWARARKFAAARYIPSEGTVEEFESFCAVVYRSSNLLVVVEEAAAVCSASYLPPAFGRIVRQGRHRGLGLLWCTQRLAEVSRTLTSLTDVWAGFSLSEPADLQALAQRCGREYADKVASLPRFDWIGYDVDSQETFTGVERLKTLWGAPAGAWPETTKEEKSPLMARKAKEPEISVTRNRKFRLFSYLR
jgi:DNA helicase HerA-like ATPase